MAQFSEGTKTLIRANLGYSNVDTLGDDTISVTLLNDILARDYDVSFINEVQAQLTKIANIDLELDNLVSSSKIKKADVVEFNVVDGASYVYKRGSSVVKYLASLIGIKPLYNRFMGGNSVSKLVGY
jgi:hypothetical protein